MGWLRDLMKAAQPPPRSFDDLARRCLSHATWPAEFQVRGRSLGTLLGKFDRELELDWLAHRPGAQRTLALVLGTTREQVLEALTPKRAAPGRYVRLDDLPSGRLLDLSEEPLFPGIPPEVLAPGAWDALWWIVPSGGGRSLVGRWLRARGLISGVELDDQPARPHYVELARGATLAPRRGLCVASPLPPETPGFHVVRSDELSTSLPALLEWAVDRLPDPGRFDRRALENWLGDLAQGGVIESAGAVLGLVGLADERGVPELVRRSPREIMNLFLRKRASEALDPEAPATHWMKRSAAEALIALLRQTLTDSDEPWWHPRTLGEWSELLPAELRREADVEWLSLSLARPGSAIRPSDVERAARELPPGAFRLLRAFERSGLLRREDSETLALRPHWLVALGLHEALAELSRAAPAEWGEALLRPYAADRVARVVAERAASGDTTLIDDVNDVDPGASPALTAATELAFRAVGLATLKNGEPPVDGVETLWNQTLELAVSAPGRAPLPRIDYAGGQALLARGSYYLAAWSLSEALPAASAQGPPALCPWSQARTAPARALLDDVQAALAAQPELRAPAARLVGRLPGGDAERHELELPALLVATSSLAAWTAAAASSFAAPVAAELVRDQPTLITNVWRDWERSGRPLLTALLQPSPLTHLLWRGAPSSALESLLEREPIGYAWLGPAQWQAVTLTLKSRGRAPVELELWRHLPDAELAELFDAGLFPNDEACLRLLWSRAPELVRHTLESAFFAQIAGAVGALLAAAPLDHSADLARALAADKRLGAVATPQLWELQRWLHDRVSRRAPGWRAVFDALVRLERRLSGASRSSL